MKPKVFISHANKPEILTVVKEFLQTLEIEPIIVEEQSNQGVNPNEKVDHYMRQCSCVIVLATADEEVNGQSKPKPNVMFEIGKSEEILPGRLILLKEKSAVLPSLVDYTYISFTMDKLEQVFAPLIKELKSFGLLSMQNPQFLETPVGQAPWQTLKTSVEEVCSEDKFRIKQHVCNYRVRGGDLFVSKRYKGINKSNKPINEFFSYGGGDSQISEELFSSNLFVYDKKTNAKNGKNRELKTELVNTVSNEFVKVIKILFASPIQPDQEFDIEIRYTWPGCLWRNPDGLFFRTNMHKGGVNQVEVNIMFEEHLQSWELTKEIGKEVYSNEGIIQPKEIEEEAGYRYHWIIDEPKHDHFFKFVRENI